MLLKAGCALYAEKANVANKGIEFKFIRSLDAIIKIEKDITINTIISKRYLGEATRELYIEFVIANSLEYFLAIPINNVANNAPEDPPTVVIIFIPIFLNTSSGDKLES